MPKVPICNQPITDKKLLSKTDGFLFRLRTYPKSAYCDIWIECKQGAPRECYMHGEMLISKAEKLASVLGLPIQRETGA